MSDKENIQSRKQINKLVAVVAATAVSLGTVVNMESAAFAATETPTNTEQTSGLLSATISPTIPTGLTVAAGNGMITANWVANTDGTDSYQVQYSTSSTFTAASTVTVTTTDNSEEISGLKPLTTYYVKVAGVSAGVIGTYSAAVTAKTFGVPSAPSTLRLTVGVKSLNATWVAPTVINGSPVSKYAIQYSTDSTFATNVNTVESVDAAELINNLTDATKYYVRVASINSVGQSAFTAAVSATTAALPSAAQTVTASAAAGSSTVAWKAPASNGGMAVTGYRVEYSKDASFATIAGNVNVASNILSTSVKPLDPSTTYFYRVIAKNALGEASASNVASATSFAVASSPNSVTAAAGVASAVVKWAAPASNGGSPVTGYNVEYSTNADFSGSKTVAASSTAVSASLTGLTAGATYYVRVAAKTLAGTGAYASAPVVKIFAAPSSPTAFTVTGGNLNFAAKWNAPATNGGTAVTGYVLEYATNSDFSNKKVVSLGATTLSSTVTGLTANTSYYVRVAAKNAAGVSTPVETININTNQTADAPASLTLKTAVGTSGPTVTPAWTASPNLYGQVLTNYSVQYSTDANFAPAATKTVLTKSLTTALSGLQSNTTFYVRVATMTAAGTGVYTAPVSIKTVAAANIPVGVTANATAAKTVVVDVPVVAGVTKTTVQASLASTFSSPITVTAVNGKATFSNLAEGKTYYFRAQDSNTAGASAYSATVSQLTIAAPVTNVTAGNVDASSAVVSWTGSAAGAASYNVYQDGVLVANVASTVGSYSFTGLNEGTSYKFSVASVNASGVSASVETNVTTGVAAPQAIIEANVSNVTSNSVDVGWTLGAGFIDGYNVYKNGILFDSVAKDVSSYSFTGLDDATAYAFSVMPFNSAGNGQSVHVTATTVLAAPAVVSGFKADSVASDSVAVSWGSADGKNIEGYNLYQDGVKVATVAAGSTSYSFTGLADNVAYKFSVAAFNSAGEAVLSDVTAKTVDVVAAVTDLKVGVSYGLDNLQHAAVSWTGVSEADSYNVYVDGVLVGSTASGVTSFDAVLAFGKTSTVTVTASKSNGTVVSAGVSVNVTTEAAPAKVLTVGTVTGYRASSSYTYNTPAMNQSGIILSGLSQDDVNAINSFGVKIFDTVVINGQRFKITNGTPASYSTWNGGYGSWSLVAELSNGPAIPAGSITSIRIESSAAASSVPKAVRDVINSFSGDSSFGVKWDKSEGASSYNIYRDGVYVGNTVDSEYVATGLQPSTAYNFTVKAVNSFGEASGVDVQGVTAASGQLTIARVDGSVNAVAADGWIGNGTHFNMGGMSKAAVDAYNAYRPTNGSKTIINGVTYINAWFYSGVTVSYGTADYWIGAPTYSGDKINGGGSSNAIAFANPPADHVLDIYSVTFAR